MHRIQELGPAAAAQDMGSERPGSSRAAMSAPASSSSPPPLDGGQEVAAPPPASPLDHVPLLFARAEANAAAGPVGGGTPGPSPAVLQSPKRRRVGGGTPGSTLRPGGHTSRAVSLISPLPPGPEGAVAAVEESGGISPTALLFGEEEEEENQEGERGTLEQAAHSLLANVTIAGDKSPKVPKQQQQGNPDEDGPAAAAIAASRPSELEVPEGGFFFEFAPHSLRLHVHMDPEGRCPLGVSFPMGNLTAEDARDTLLDTLSSIREKAGLGVGAASLPSAIRSLDSLRFALRVPLVPTLSEAGCRPHVTHVGTKERHPACASQRGLVAAAFRSWLVAGLRDQPAAAAARAMCGSSNSVSPRGRSCPASRPPPWKRSRARPSPSLASSWRSGRSIAPGWPAGCCAARWPTPWPPWRRS